MAHFPTFKNLKGVNISNLNVRHLLPELDELRKIVSEYDQEIPQSQTADNPVAPRGRAAQPPRDIRKTNQAKQSAVSSPSR